MQRRLSSLCVALAIAGCGPTTTPVRDTGLGGLALLSIAPSTWLPTTRVHITGRSFVPPELGTATIVFADRDDALGSALLTYVSPSEAYFDVSTLVATAVGIGATARSITAQIEYESTVDHAVHPSSVLTLEVAKVASLTPELTAVGDGIAYVNGAIPIVGDDLLLDGEGTTKAVLTGCFRAESSDICGAPITREVPVTATNPTVRTDGNFVYRTSISGIVAGDFSGTMHLQNDHLDGTSTMSSDVAITFNVQPATLNTISTLSASLGQYVVITGGGFVGADPSDPSTDDELTTLRLVGTFTPDDQSGDVSIDVEIVPEVRSGTELRYVLDEGDALGQAIALRTQSGLLDVTISLVVEKGSTKIDVPPLSLGLTIAPLKQIVYINFLDEWVSALRRLGLRAADPQIRQRILAVAARDYGGVNVEFRLTPVDDFAVYSQVDLAGIYPAGDHSFGYDNTPGKDVGNVRLFDRIGGVNAQSQAGGAPGYGGVFLESFFLFSTHPPSDIKANLQNDPTWPLIRTPVFDEIFDPFRADRGGKELTATELAELAPPTLDSTENCPALKTDRRGQIACAILVVGNMIGTTMTHEVGHSLGLSDPGGDNTHNPGDCPSRLMDGGAFRPFDERSELGAAFGRFCVDDYTYLRQILPGPLDLVVPDVDRPTCARCL